ncbi:MAG: dihydroorotate dehydrogenase electron transfer subunit [Bacillota bacterium]
MTFAGITEIVWHEKIAPDHYLMRVLAPEIAKKAKPGQFVHVLPGSTMDPLLRRPISLHGIDPAKGTISLLYRVVGRGTRMMSEMPVGGAVDIMGPLGKGFDIPDKISKVLVVGGGIGVAPLLSLLQALRHYNIDTTVLLGAATGDYLLGVRQIEALGLKAEAATDDGTYGYKGFVTDLVSRQLTGQKPDYFYACGPNPMLSKLTKMMTGAGIPGQVSLEERMGCGVGACLACVCKVKVAGAPQQGSGAAPQFDYKKVCADGPVFAASEVIFDE